MEIFFQQLINGIVLGSVYAMVAVGYTMVYGILQLINFAHGEVLMIGAMFCSLSSIGFAYVDSFMMALLCRFFMGLGASFGFVCLLVSVHDWMPHKHLAIFIGLSQFIGTLGPMIATGPLETFAQASAADRHHRSAGGVAQARCAERICGAA